MNWLAHFALSDPSPAFRVGSILPDLLRGGELLKMPGVFRLGIERHLWVDRFTDSHPVVRRSIVRFSAPFRRWGGVLVDVFYDHFLARDWGMYSAASLEEFAGTVYGSFEECREDLPASTYACFEAIRGGDLLCSYREVGGVAAALGRMSRRLRRAFDLSAAVSVLEAQYEGFHEDFAQFYPELVRGAWASGGASCEHT